MVRSSGKSDTNLRLVGVSKPSLEDETDRLFKLPLSEFAAERNALAARLKKESGADVAAQVKSLTKPSITAWVVNQLYWKHPKPFEQLLASGQSFRQTQKSSPAGKLANLRDSLDARRNLLSQLTDLATALLKSAGHNPTPDTVRRVSTTLEAVSAYASMTDGPTPGRLTRDVDPPGFDSLTSLMAGGGFTPPVTSHKTTPAKQVSKAVAKAPPKSESVHAATLRRLEKTRQEKIAAAKVALQRAKRVLTESQAKSQRLETSQKKTGAEAREAEKDLREAKTCFERATAVAKYATERAQSIAAELEEATKALADARLGVEAASEKLESLFREAAAK